MPRVALDSVVSVSSEHSEHPASNIFTESDAYWTCGKQDDKQASIIIQLQSSTKINSIHIGNHGSAFVEVLVSSKAASASKEGEDFKVLLLCSSLMTLQESRGEKNMKGVKMFTSDKLNSDVRDQYWDRVKVVCTQPFNKHLYGLTFLKLSGETRDVKTETQPATSIAPSASGVAQPNKNNPLSSLSVPSVTSDLAPDTIKIGSFFKNRQSLTNSINAATSAAKGTDSTKPGSLASEMRTAAPSELVPKKPEDDSLSSSTPSNDSPARSKPPRKIPKLEATTTSTTPVTTSKPAVSRQNSKEAASTNKTPQQNPKPTPIKQASVKSEELTPKTPTVKYDSFENLMNGVVICLSGFVNPLRGELRQKAVEMGAKYKQDWAGECTHLICAFANTPKFNQVRKNSPSAYVVKKEWILDCHQQRTKLNLTKYSMIPLSQQAKNEPEIKASPDDDSKASENKATSSKTMTGSSTTSTLRPREQSSHKKKSDSNSPDYNEKQLDEESAYDAETDDEYNPYEEQAHYDSDEEPEQLISIKKASSSTTTATVSKASTKGESDNKEVDLDKMELPPLPDFFRRRKFMLFGDFDTEMRRIMKRLIIAYNGILLEYMGEDVNYIVTNERWSDKFDQVLEDNSSVQFVRPSWLTACDKQQKTVPLQYHLELDNPGQQRSSEVRVLRANSHNQFLHLMTT